MTRIENDCAGCASPAFPCLGDECPFKNAPHVYCDICHAEEGTMYDVDGVDVCEECLVDYLLKSRIIERKRVF